MDVHRSRFVPYPSSAINALAFSRQSEPHQNGDEDVRLAVGRANGDIEIWNPSNGAWVQEVVFRGGKDRSVEGLAWTQEPDEQDDRGHTISGQLRLFSIGYSSSVTEWDLATGLPLRHSGGNSSEVWCMAAQPAWASPSKEPGQTPVADGRQQQNIVAGCADGTLALLGTADNDLQFMRYLTRPNLKRARCLSVTWQNRDVVIAGFADSTIRVYSKDATLVRTISLGAGPVKGPREILVWSVKCLPNGDIVSGDSTGDIRFFDGKYYSQIQRVSGHETDCLAVAASQDGQTVFSTGPDRRLAVYRLGSATGGSKRRWWAKASHQRHHSHDVKALASYEDARLSVLISGGVDTNLLVYPIRGHGEEYGRTIAGLPQQQHAISTEDRLLVSWWDREVWIWQMQRSPRGSEPHRLLTKVALKGEESITAVTAAASGSVLAIATAAEVRLFSLRVKGVQPVQTLRVRKLEAPKTLQGRGGRLVQLSRDGKWLAVVRQDAEIQLYRIVTDDSAPGGHRIITTVQDLPRISRKASTTESNTGLGKYDRTVTRLQFSSDGHALVASDLSGYIDGWLLAGHEDSTAREADMVGDIQSTASDSGSDDDETQTIIFLGQTWRTNPAIRLLPKLDAAPLILAFRPAVSTDQPEPNGNPAVHATRHNPHPIPHDMPTGPYSLVVVTSEHQIYEFDLLSGQTTRWSRRNPPSLLPPSFTSIRDRAIGATWHVTQLWQRLWLYGHNWVYMFDLAQDLDAGADTTANAVSDAAAQKKRKREDDTKRSQKATSGAGSRLKERDLDGFGRRVRRVDEEAKADKSLEYSSFHAPTARSGVDEEMDEDDEDDMEGVVLSRRRALDDSDSEGGPQSVTGDGEVAKKGPAKSWHTFKYRPILGMVPLSPAVDLEADGNDAVLEVVLIERPSWDLDLPPRFVGVHERGE